MKKCFFLCALLSVILLSAPAFASSSSIPTNISYYCPNCRTGCTFFQSNVSGDICVSSVMVTYRCTRCNSYTITQNYPSAGHDWRESNRVPATCTSSGDIFYYCSRCSTMRQETIPALGGSRDWSETSRTPATCTVAGSIVSTCSRCRDVKRTAINRLYEDKVTGELSAERFSKMLTNYENEQSELRKHCELLHLTVIEERESSENASRFIKMVRQFTEMQALTDEIVSTLIERIEVGEAEKFNGQRRQTIKIVYNFIGEIPSDTE